MDEFNARGASTHGYTNPSEKVDTAYVESQSEETDKHGFTIKKKPGGLESVRKSVENCEMMAGLDKNVMASLLKGEWNEWTTSDHSGRMSKKIVIEYDIKQKSPADN
ncbi:MAG: hypothetical protein CMA59_00490 [Euryarchaeota archaeon]|jgi:hypothetical protein|nr:hypothetical protein [Euryarchaeota archaeon]|tara:strand:- start:2687 stop:3007 length:321 start_codon:yes stop_codon:yes gene_type:complete